MPKFSAEPEDALTVADALHARGLKHLRARRRADLVTIESGPDVDAHAHARLRRVAVSLWRLEMATHTGRWEVTPFRGRLAELLDTLVEAFPWTLQPLE